MKLRYFFLSAVMASVALTGFTSCSDDDEDAPLAPKTEQEDLTLSTDMAKVKIGAENRVLLPVATGAGDYNAYSLNPEVADIVTGDDGAAYIEGYKNGSAGIVVSDAANRYKRLSVMVYTTETLLVNETEINLGATMGQTITYNNCAVTEGNGEYTITSDLSYVNPTINSESGAITISAKVKSEEYTAVLTISDVSGLTAEVRVTVTPSFDPFTDAEISDLMAKTATDFSYNGNQPGFSYRGTISESNSNGKTKFGFRYTSSYWWGGTTIYNCQIEYPSDAAVGQEVEGSLYYTNGSSYESSHKGMVKLLADDATKRVAIWYNVDMFNERIDRGYVVWIK